MPINREADKDDVVPIDKGLLLNHKKERNSTTYRDMDRPRDCHTERCQQERKKLCESMLICGIYGNGIDELICKADIETDVENKGMDTKAGRWVG